MKLHEQSRVFGMYVNREAFNQFHSKHSDGFVLLNFYVHKYSFAYLCTHKHIMTQNNL